MRKAKEKMQNVDVIERERAQNVGMDILKKPFEDCVV